MKENIMEQNNIPATVEAAVNAFIDEDDTASAINYLRNNKKEIGEFCMQIFESYGENDKSGIYRLSQIIEELL